MNPASPSFYFELRLSFLTRSIHASAAVERSRRAPPGVARGSARPVRPARRHVPRCARRSPVTKSPQAWMRTSPFGSRSNSAGSAWPIDVCPNTRARPSDCRPPAKHSDALPVIPSTRIATGPLYGSTRSPGGVDEPRIRGELQLRLPRLHHAERRALGHEVPGDAHDHRREPAGIAAQIDHDAVGRCGTRPSPSGTGGSTAVIQTLKPMTPARAAARRRLQRRRHAHEHRRQAARR